MILKGSDNFHKGIYSNFKDTVAGFQMGGENFFFFFCGLNSDIRIVRAENDRENDRVNWQFYFFGLRRFFIYSLY